MKAFHIECPKHGIVRAVYIDSHELCPLCLNVNNYPKKDKKNKSNKRGKK